MTEVLATLVLVFALDRGAKALAFREPEGGSRRLSGGLVTVRTVRNARPGLWPSGSPVAWVRTFAGALAAGVLLVRLDLLEAPVARVGLGLALGGALGNLFDRLRHGAVLDFLELGRRSGRFNPADAALVLGLSALLGSYLFAAAGALVST